MKDLTSEIRILRWYNWLLGAAAWLALLTSDNSLGLLVVAILTVACIVLLRQANHAFLKVIFTLIGFAIVFSLVFVLLKLVSAVLPIPAIPNSLGWLLWCVLSAFLAAGLTGGTMRASARKAEQRASSAASKVDSASANHAVEARTKITSTEDPAAQEWVQWALAHAPTPRSRMYATLAGAIRALEMGKDHAAIEQAAQATANAWAAPPTVTLRDVGDDVLPVTEEPWAPATALSQALATRAGYLRALELGKDKAAAVEASRKTLQQWIPQHPSAGFATGAKTGGESRGLVYGYMRRSEAVQLGADPLRRGRSVSMSKAVWTFAIKREGTGGNGRPFSPIQIRIEGATVSGSLEDGDLVELPHAPVAAEVNSYQRVRNLSKGVDIVAQPISEASEYKSYRWQRIVFQLIGLLVFGIIAYAMVSYFSMKSAPVRQMFPR